MVNSDEMNYRYKVLIVDDIPKNLQVLGNILDEKGIDISFATSGAQALELVDFNQPDLILLDISMPELDGYEVCQRLKENPKSVNIPIIFLTARTEVESIVQGFKVGGQDYITKPFNAEELLARVRTHLELKDKREAVEKYTQQLEMWNEKQLQLNRFLQKQKEIIAQKNKDLTDSINYAQIIQNAMLPSLDKLKTYFAEVFVLYRPKYIVSGDFYFCEKIVDPITSTERIVMVVADCTGHGVPGALLTVMGISILKQIIVYEKISNPCDILYRLNSEIADMLANSESDGRTSDGMDIALCTIDPLANTLTFSGCKRPLYFVRNKELTVFNGSIHSIGGFYDDEKKEFTNQVIDLYDNDTFYLSSDGFVSQFGGEYNKKFNRNRLSKVLVELDSANLPLIKHRAYLNDVLNEWMGTNEQIDDILVIGFKYQKPNN